MKRQHVQKEIQWDNKRQRRQRRMAAMTTTKDKRKDASQRANKAEVLKKEYLQKTIFHVDLVLNYMF